MPMDVLKKKNKIKSKKKKFAFSKAFDTSAEKLEISPNGPLRSLQKFNRVLIFF